MAKTRVVYVDKDECSACSQCVDSLPKYFKTDADDYAESHIDGKNLNAAPIPEEDWKKVQNEVDECPTESIRWKD